MEEEAQYVTVEDAEGTEEAADIDEQESLVWSPEHTAQILVVETEDGQQQFRVVTENDGEVLSLPPELASQLQESLSELSGEELAGVQQLVVTDEGEQLVVTDGGEQLVVTDEGEQPAEVAEEQCLLVPADFCEDQILLTEDGGQASVYVTQDESGQQVLVTGVEDGEAALAALAGQSEEDVAESEMEHESFPDSVVDAAAPPALEPGVEESAVKTDETELESPPDLDQVPDHAADEQEESAVPEDALDIKLELPDVVEDMADEREDDEEPEGGWTEAFVTSAAGVQLKVRLPAFPSVEPSIAVSESAESADAGAVQTETAAERPRRRPRSPLPEVWQRESARSSHRTASRGIARAVAALKRSSSDDEFLPSSSDDDEEEERRRPRPPPRPPVLQADGTVKKRGRGRPRRNPALTCQVCGRALPTEALLLQHVEQHCDTVRPKEDPDGAGNVALAAVDEGHGAAELNVHIFATNSKLVYDCLKCDQLFNTEDELNMHAKVHVRQQIVLAAREEVAAQKSLGVGAGGDRLESDGGAETVAGGVPTVSEEVQYEMKNLKPCKLCPRIFTTVGALQNHICRTHRDSPEAAGLQISEYKRNKIEQECEECHVTYTSDKIYRRHLELHDNQRQGRLPFPCRTCSRSFITSQQLKHHQSREHPDLREQAGTEGRRRIGRPHGSSNSDRQQVYDLIQRTDDGRFACSLCGSEGRTKNSMFYHVSIKHNALRGHECDVCQKKYFNESALRAHQRLHTGERPFSCDTCQRRFRQLAELTGHVSAVHQKERPHQCKFCGKCFSRKYSMVVHMRCHTNERNYKCHICSKGFRASTYLNGHMKIHTGERVHKCPICHKGFRMRSDMKRHIFTHSRDRPRDRSLRVLTMNGAQPAPAAAPAVQDQEQGLVLLDGSELCGIQLVDEDGAPLVIATEDLGHSQPVIDPRTGQILVPEDSIADYDETAMASMYLVAADNGMEVCEDASELV